MKRLFYSFVLAVFVLIAHYTLNTDNCEAQWVQTPGIPEGGGVTDMVIAENGNIVVTTASFNWPNGQDGGVRWSSDEGATWNAPFNYFNARTLALGQNGWVFCSAWNFPATERLYASTDNGQTWPMSLYTVGTNDNIFSILEQDNNQTIYIGTRNGVLKSTNGGVNFNSANNGIPANSWVRDLESDFDGVIAAATTNGLFYTTNDGSDWLKVNGIPASDTVVTLSFNTIALRNNGPESELLAGTQIGGIYLIAPVTSNAEELSRIPGSVEISKLKQIANRASPFNGYIAYTFLGGVYVSQNGGNTWKSINEGLPDNPPVSAGTFIPEVSSFSRNGNTIKLVCGLFENSLNGAGVYINDYTVGIQSLSTEIPKDYSLEQNYPNPFNPVTKIKFSVRERSVVKITVFDALGKELDKLVNKELAPGIYQTEFNGSKFNSGVYFYRMTIDSFSETKKMILVK